MSVAVVSRARARRAGARGVEELLLVARGGRRRSRRGRTPPSAPPASPGRRRPGIPGNVTDTVVAVRASGENEGGGEVKENLVDGSDESKWLVFEPTAWVELELADPVKVVRYALTSANDAAERDPRDWTLKGSNDGTTWTTLDTRSGEDFSGALPDQGVRVRQRRRLPPLPPRHHREPRRRPDPARRAPALQRRHHPAAGGGHAHQRRRRPARRLQRQVGRRLHRAARAAVRRSPHQRGPRLLLQQGLRRRREASSAGPSCPT